MHSHLHHGLLETAQVCQGLHSLMGTFWWGHCPKEKKVHWVDWKTIPNAKQIGGMGFMDLESFNDALLARQVCRLFLNAMVQDFEEPFFSQIHCDRMERGRGGQVKLSFLLSFFLSIKIKTKSFLKGKKI